MASSPIPFTEIKVLSFDVYGTLLDWETGIFTSAHASALGPYLPQDRKTLLLAIERHDTSVQQESPSTPQTQVIAEGLRRYARELRVVEDGHLTQAQVDQACEEYGGSIGTYGAFPDTVAAMKRLGKHYRLVPLSNVDHKSFERTSATALKGVDFAAVYIAEDIGSYKPDLANFRYLLEHVKSDFGVDKGGLLHMAQSLVHDHSPCKEMGIQSVWVDRKGVMGGGEQREGAREKYGFELGVESIGELAEIVDKAFEGSKN